MVVAELTLTLLVTNARIETIAEKFEQTPADLRIARQRIGNVSLR